MKWQTKNKWLGWNYIKFQWAFTNKVFRVYENGGKFWVNTINESYEVLPNGVLKGYHRKYEALTDINFPDQSKKTVCTKPLQVKAWIDNNKALMVFWQTVVTNESHHLQNKTREEAIALANYYEGRYDMACNFMEILEEEE